MHILKFSQFLTEAKQSKHIQLRLKQRIIDSLKVELPYSAIKLLKKKGLSEDLVIKSITDVVRDKFIEKFKPSLIVFVGGIIVALSWIASSFATNILFLTLSYGVLGGAGAGIIYGVPMAVVAKWFPAKKGLAVGIVLM